MKLIDITRPLRTGMPVWPGDTPAEFKLVSAIAAGAGCNVGRLRISVHTGTHADAPFHYNQSGARMHELPAELFVGPARVVDIRGQAMITPALLAAQDFSATPRVLFRSDTWTDPDVFPATWPLFAPETPAWLAARGVKLVGMDVPSVDPLVNEGMPLHHALDAAGIIILENLDLTAVTAGVYELIALPLKIQDGDGSPIRAILRQT